MLKIFSVDQIRKADSYTISHEPIASIDLMERAARQVFDWIVRKLKGERADFFIFCGPGNNGGDGLAVARMLHAASYKVNVAIPDEKEKFSTDFNLNLVRLRESGIVPASLSEACGWTPAEDSIIIDALFGSGLS
jgi:NAD(P)H-hydrate epimerase